MLKSLVIALASIGSVALAKPSTRLIQKRDVSSIVANLAELTTAVSWNVGNISAYQGGLDGAILFPLITASNLVDTVLHTTTIDIVAHASFSEDDSQTLISTLTPLVSLLKTTLETLNAKQSLFRAANIHGIVLDSIKKHSAAEDLVYVKLIEKATLGTQNTFQSLRVELETIYNVVVAAYSAV
ncbi:hypothetical protein M7I_7224 [Glarea lozoyensis 74030]|nr:hypothetical protein M7I_7224 [Glarea lozoyensis 74030]